MDYKTKKYDETNQGRLFKNTDGWIITHQGKINFDGDDHRIIGVARLNQNKEPITELYHAIGTLKEKPKTKKDAANTASFRVRSFLALLLLRQNEPPAQTRRGRP